MISYSGVMDGINVCQEDIKFLKQIFHSISWDGKEVWDDEPDPELEYYDDGEGDDDQESNADEDEELEEDRAELEGDPVGIEIEKDGEEAGYWGDAESEDE
ncbi:hypothetical protein NEOLEDRAFT_1136730 [Neolentinus lepideus HHB14362 ss-1]|uniref:Uncharacterized protein n=1 Tax=Neolentinus lepideus HHB14362 ss-1 TaxID=1314782 RepID=A0A165R639_9AGAM|nr:hypothetical protein NEOLEDRAFT_1136730 [Neolentinus lepideus HHB14362 ss-1]